MEKQSVLEFLSSFVKQQKSEVNYGTYRETTRSSLLKDGLGTRAERDNVCRELYLANKKIDSLEVGR